MFSFSKKKKIKMIYLNLKSFFKTFHLYLLSHFIY